LTEQASPWLRFNGVVTCPSFLAAICHPTQHCRVFPRRISAMTAAISAPSSKLSSRGWTFSTTAALACCFSGAPADRDCGDRGETPCAAAPSYATVVVCDSLTRDGVRDKSSIACAAFSESEVVSANGTHKFRGASPEAASGKGATGGRSACHGGAGDSGTAEARSGEPAGGHRKPWLSRVLCGIRRNPRRQSGDGQRDAEIARGVEGGGGEAALAPGEARDVWEAAETGGLSAWMGPAVAAANAATAALGDLVMGSSRFCFPSHRGFPTRTLSRTRSGGHDAAATSGLLGRSGGSCSGRSASVQQSADGDGHGGASEGGASQADAWEKSERHGAAAWQESGASVDEPSGPQVLSLAPDTNDGSANGGGLVGGEAVIVAEAEERIVGQKSDADARADADADARGATQMGVDLQPAGGHGEWPWGAGKCGDEGSDPVAGSEKRLLARELKGDGGGAEGGKAGKNGFSAGAGGGSAAGGATGSGARLAGKPVNRAWHHRGTSEGEGAGARPSSSSGAVNASPMPPLPPRPQSSAAVRDGKGGAEGARQVQGGGDVQVLRMDWGCGGEAVGVVRHGRQQRRQLQAQQEKEEGEGEHVEQSEELHTVHEGAADSHRIGAALESGAGSGRTSRGDGRESCVRHARSRSMAPALPSSSTLVHIHSFQQRVRMFTHSSTSSASPTARPPPPLPATAASLSADRTCMRTASAPLAAVGWPGHAAEAGAPMLQPAVPVQLLQRPRSAGGRTTHCSCLSCSAGNSAALHHSTASLGSCTRDRSSDSCGLLSEPWGSDTQQPLQPAPPMPAPPALDPGVDTLVPLAPLSPALARSGVHRAVNTGTGRSSVARSSSGSGSVRVARRFADTDGHSTNSPTTFHESPGPSNRSPMRPPRSPIPWEQPSATMGAAGPGRGGPMQSALGRQGRQGARKMRRWASEDFRDAMGVGQSPGGARQGGEGEEGSGSEQGAGTIRGTAPWASRGQIVGNGGESVQQFEWMGEERGSRWASEAAGSPMASGDETREQTGREHERRMRRRGMGQGAWRERAPGAVSGWEELEFSSAGSGNCDSGGGSGHARVGAGPQVQGSRRLQKHRSAPIKSLEHVLVGKGAGGDCGDSMNMSVRVDVGAGLMDDADMEFMSSHWPLPALQGRASPRVSVTHKGF
ncbi:hypothetical protein CLOM_g19893, partial [Closterium sp. NIES-68]